VEEPGELWCAGGKLWGELSHDLAQRTRVARAERQGPEESVALGEDRDVDVIGQAHGQSGATVGTRRRAKAEDLEQRRGA
jgi:hypothetical protein